ncbi:MAG: hypothetical protein LC721_03405, partial [Actinobacteria bacterium]|nr:hypothetical protein [Actinomycetota bacterium]
AKLVALRSNLKCQIHAVLASTFHHDRAEIRGFVVDVGWGGESVWAGVVSGPVVVAGAPGPWSCGLGWPVRVRVAR